MSYIQTFVSTVSFMWMGHRRSIHLETTKHRKTKAIGITLQGQPKYEPKMPYQLILHSPLRRMVHLYVSDKAASAQALGFLFDASFFNSAAR